MNWWSDQWLGCVADPYIADIFRQILNSQGLRIVSDRCIFPFILLKVLVVMDLQKKHNHIRNKKIKTYKDKLIQMRQQGQSNNNNKTINLTNAY